MWVRVWKRVSTWESLAALIARGNAERGGSARETSARSAARVTLYFWANLQNKTNATVESAGGSLSSVAALIGRGNAGNARGGREARREN